MVTMDDLISSFSGGVHVGQEAMDIKALQDYLSQHMPPLATPISPGGSSYRPVAPSRSTSSTRAPNSLPLPPSFNFNEAFAQPYPSPVAQASYLPMHAEDMPMDLGTPHSRPGARRGNSYGFGMPPASPAYDSFESDAFAPLWQQEAGPSDPWARIRLAQNEQSERQQAFSSYAPQPSGGSSGWFRAAQGPWGGVADSKEVNNPYPTPPREEDEDQARTASSTDGMEEDDAGSTAQMRRAGSQEEQTAAQQREQSTFWDRGRRKT